MRLLLLFAAVAASASAHSQMCPAMTTTQASALSLADAVERASVCHPDVRAAVGPSQLQARTSSHLANRPIPSHSGGSSVGKDLGNGTFFNKTFDHSVRVDQTIERGGKPGLRRAASQALLDAAEQTCSKLDAVQAVGQPGLSRSGCDIGTTGGNRSVARTGQRRATSARAACKDRRRGSDRSHSPCPRCHPRPRPTSAKRRRIRAPRACCWRPWSGRKTKSTR